MIQKIGILIILCMLLAVASFHANAKTIYVDDDGGKDYDSIQKAIDNSSHGDTIFVYAGDYYENIDVYESDGPLTIVGENKEDTIIYGDGIVSQDVVDLYGSHVNFSGFTVKNSGKFDSGIDISGDNVNVFNNILTENGDGVGLAYCTSAKVYDNIINDNRYQGISFLDSCNNGIIKNNMIYSNNLYGIDGYSCDGNIIIGNTFRGHDTGISFSYSADNIITGNVIEDHSNRPMRLYHCDNHYIYFNNFQNNNRDTTDNGNNQWDNGQKGNYWDDYTGTDSNGDGVGETAYDISDGDNQDRYPLTSAWSGDIEEINTSIMPNEEDGVSNDGNDSNNTVEGEDSSDDKGTPGFEPIFVVCAIALVLLWKRRRP